MGLGHQVTTNVSLSTDCRNTLLTITNSSSPQYQCLQIDALLPALTTNGSIIPPVNNYLEQICSSSPCNSTVLNQTASAISENCGSDLEQFGISSDYVEEIIGYYDLARDVVCLKNENDEVLSNATIPLNSTMFNSTASSNMTSGSNSTTNGTFCLTELALNVTGYLGVNLTNSYIDTLLLGGNYSALQALENIPPTAICSDCIFAAVNLINEENPGFGEIVVNRTGNVTINDYLDNTCSAQGYNATGNGTLPEGIYDASNATSSVLPSASSSSAAIASSSSASGFATSSIATVTGAAGSVAGAATSGLGGVTNGAGSAAAAATSGVAQAVGAMAEKRRWIGQQ